MFSKVVKKLNTDTGMYIIISFLSAIVFCLIYGIKVINPTYTDWLLSGGDLSQHYLGWKAYRSSSWHFPIGMSDTLAYPNQTSIIFTDSIPIFAVFFKLLSPILPAEFQYFGIWGIMCFVLQGIFSARIIKKYSFNRVITIISSMLFTCVPIVILRMYAHTALAGQWIIIFALDLIFNSEKYRNKKRVYSTVTIMGILVASIHMYFVLMCGIILAGYMLNELLEYKDIKRCLIVLLDYLLSVVIIISLLGGFSSGMQADNAGLGVYSFNLNGFFNPQGWSNIYKDLTLCGTGQYEGFAYLGAGCIILMIFAIISFVSNINLLTYLKNNWKVLISLFTVLIISVVVALSPTVTLNSRVIVALKLPHIVFVIWSVFRASGRVVWTVNYIIMLTSVIVLLKTVNKSAVYIVCSLAVIIQFYDLHSILLQKNMQFNKVNRYNSVLTTKDFWDCLSDNKEVKHVEYYSEFNEMSNFYYSITDWALSNGKTVSDFYFARPLDSVKVSREKAFSELSNDTIFIFTEEEKANCLKYNLHYYEVDGIIVGCPHKIGDFEEMKKSDFTINCTFWSDERKCA